MSWNWKRFVGGPGVVLAIRHTVLLDHMVTVLCHKAADLDDEDLPTLSRREIQAEVREFFANHGERGMEDVWSDGLTRALADEIEAWANVQIAAAWPEYAQAGGRS